MAARVDERRLDGMGAIEPKSGGALALGLCGRPWRRRSPAT